MNSISWLKIIDRYVGPILVRLLSPSDRVVVLESGVYSSFLVIRPGGIGDAVLLAPLAQALQEYFPNATVDFLVEKRNRGVISMYGSRGRIFCYDRPTDLISVMLRHYDVVIDTEQWHYLSAIVARLIRARLRVGFATNDRAKLFSRSVPYSLNDYEVISFLRLLGPFGVPAVPSTMPSSLLVITDAAKAQAASLLTGVVLQSMVVIFPGASVLGKCWGAEKFRQVGQALIQRGLTLVVVGSSQDIANSEKIVADGFGVNLAGRTSLVETTAILEQAAIVISGDSGVLHLAATIGRPTVAIFGPSSSTKWAPRGMVHVVVQHTLSCSPCSSFGHMPKCLNNFRCLNDISVEDVIAAVECLQQKTTEGRQ